jgi:hypothetical protein
LRERGVDARPFWRPYASAAAHDGGGARGPDGHRRPVVPRADAAVLHGADRRRNRRKCIGAVREVLAA